MPTGFALPDVAAPLQALLAWLDEPSTKLGLQDAVSEAVAEAEQYVLSNTSLRVPRQREQRLNGFRPWLDAFAAHGFEHWLNSYKHKLAQNIQNEVLSAFPRSLWRLAEPRACARDGGNFDLAGARATSAGPSGRVAADLCRSRTDACLGQPHSWRQPAGRRAGATQRRLVGLAPSPQHNSACYRR